MTLSLDDRAIATADNREAWLRARRAGVTATEMAKLAHGGAARAALLREKRTGVSDFTGNRYTEWGKLREPLIAAWVQDRFDIAPNATVFHAAEEPRHLATPDGVGDDCLSEIKTGKYDYSEPPRDYLVQMWWAQYVCDKPRTLYAFEQHDDNWPDPQPLNGEPTFRWIERDETEIAALIKIADDFLAELYAEDFDTPTYDLELDELAQVVLAHREGEASEKKSKEAAWSQLMSKLKGRDSVSQESALARITYSTVNTPTVEPDEEAARAADPDLFERFERMATELAEHRAKFIKSGTSTKTTLTVTPIKKKA